MKRGAAQLWFLSDVNALSRVPWRRQQANVYLRAWTPSFSWSFCSFHLLIYIKYPGVLSWLSATLRHPLHHRMCTDIFRRAEHLRGAAPFVLCWFISGSRDDVCVCYALASSWRLQQLINSPNLFFSLFLLLSLCRILHWAFNLFDCHAIRRIFSRAVESQ
jgi:hypothetical protein